MPSFNLTPPVPSTLSSVPVPGFAVPVMGTGPGLLAPVQPLQALPISTNQSTSVAFILIARGGCKNVHLAIEGAPSGILLGVAFGFTSAPVYEVAGQPGIALSSGPVLMMPSGTTPGGVIRPPTSVPFVVTRGADSKGVVVLTMYAACDQGSVELIQLPAPGAYPTWAPVLDNSNVATGLYIAAQNVDPGDTNNNTATVADLNENSLGAVGLVTQMARTATTADDVADIVSFIETVDPNGDALGVFEPVANIGGWSATDTSTGVLLYADITAGVVNKIGNRIANGADATGALGITSLVYT